MGKDNWFELSGGSRNQGFEKLGFYFTRSCLMLMAEELIASYTYKLTREGKIKQGFKIVQKC